MGACQFIPWAFICPAPFQQLHLHTSIHPMGTDSPCTISVTQGDHSQQPYSRYYYPMHIDSPCTISTAQGDHSQQCTCPFIPWALIRPAPFQQLKVTIPSSECTCPLIPRALIRPTPFQQLKVAILGSIGACIFIP